MRNNTVDLVAWVLVIVGALNWLLVGAFEFNLVDELLGVQSALSKLVYVLVGLAGIYLAVKLATRSSATREV